MLPRGAFCVFFLILQRVGAILPKHGYHYNALQISQGVPVCDSNCTYISSKNHKLMTCRVQACDGLKYEEADVSLPPDIIDVSLKNYTDQISGEAKMALSIKWSPVDFGALKYTTGYLVQISDDTSSYLGCYILQEEMDFFSNRKDIFENDCFKITHQTGKNYDSIIHASVSSLPLRASNPEYTQATILIIPGSDHDETDDMANPDKVRERKRKNRKKLIGVVEDIYCQNASIKYSYMVHRHFGERASVEICEADDDGGCRPEHVANLYPDLKPNGILYLKITPLAKPDTKYRISLSGNKATHQVNVTFVTFEACSEALRGNNLNTSIIVVFVILFALGVIAVTVFLLKYQKRKRILNRSSDNRSNNVYEVAPCEDDGLMHNHDDDISVTSDAPVPCPDPIKVYVAFMDDHPLHTNVAISFCVFLRSVLALDVRTNLYEEDYPYNPISNIVKNLEGADKVVLICSEGMEENSETNGWQGNMFKPVAQYVRDQIFAWNKPEKFLICYFSYTSVEHVHKCLCNLTTVPVYKLMDNFDEFYFHLIGYEKYQKQGRICRFKEIESGENLDPVARKHRAKLEKSIRDMTKFASENPAWYKDSHLQDIAGEQDTPCNAGDSSSS